MNSPDFGRIPPVYSRRQMLGFFANGFGMLGLAGLLADARGVLASDDPAPDPLAPKPPTMRRRRNA